MSDFKMPEMSAPPTSLEKKKKEEEAEMSLVDALVSVSLFLAGLWLGMRL